MAVFFKCKNCGQEHSCPLFFSDENSFLADTVGTIVLACSVTKKTASYEKRHMFWLNDRVEKQTQARSPGR
jgi:hypothetical protein